MNTSNRVQICLVLVAMAQLNCGPSEKRSTGIESTDNARGQRPTQLLRPPAPRSKSPMPDIVTRFSLDPLIISHDDTIRISVRLENTSRIPVRFRFLVDFAIHIELLDTNGDVVRWKHSLIPEVPYREVSIDSGKMIEMTFHFPFGAYYSVQPGEYEIRFQYDDRLLRLPERHNTWVRWTEQSFQVRITDHKP